MTAPPCSGTDNNTDPTQKTALVVPSGSDASGTDSSGDSGTNIDELLSSVLAGDGWSIRRAVHGLTVLG